MLESWINDRLKEQEEKQALRTLRTDLTGVDFSSNDYLGLSANPELNQLILDRLSALPARNGATGSRLLTGNTSYTQSVESLLAEFFKAESALIFNSGYMANLAILSSIPQKGDTIIYDESSHACIKDGARLSLANRFSFRHNDVGDLTRKLAHARGRIFIVTESIFSMSGDQAPLQELGRIADQYQANLIVDEAHSTGIYGEDGNGLSTSLSLNAGMVIRVFTFGKAPGIHGACVTGSAPLIHYLINFARPFIYTTALSPHSIASIECVITFLRQQQNLRDRLFSNITCFETSAREAGLAIAPTGSPIHHLIIPGNENVRQASRYLAAKGFDVRAILAPTVRAGSEQLRIIIHAHNTEEQILNLISSFKELQSTDA